MSDLSITTRESKGVNILGLSGDIALGESSAKLNETLRGLVLEGKRNIVLNLSQVRRIDSSGLGTLVAGYTTVEKSGGKLKLSNMPERVTELMTMTKLHTVFDIFDNDAEAAGSFDGVSSDLATAPLDGGAATGSTNGTIG